MKIGLVCPYSFEAPGGVQAHILDLSQQLISKGHSVSILAPGSFEGAPEWFVSVGEAVPVRFNGSVARLSFGPHIGVRTRAWLEDGHFDVVHIHEPGSPSVGLHALMNADVPIVATFHAALDRSLLRKATSGLVQPFFERISARIAVSEEARRTLMEHHDVDAVVIPNGIFCRPFVTAQASPQWSGSADAPTVVFLGRLDEPRKGLEVLAGAIADVVDHIPGVRFLIAGRGEAQALAAVRDQYPHTIELLGEISDTEKATLLSSADVYVAPQTGGESFGIVLVEAMAAGAAVVASDIPAFSAVLDDGRLGRLFRTADSSHLAQVLVDELGNPNEERTRIAQEESWRYDWNTVAEQILAVYQVAARMTEPVETGTLWERLSGRQRGHL